MKKFYIKSDNILYKDEEGIYFLLTDQQAMQVGSAKDLNPNSETANTVISCKSIKETTINFYEESEDSIFVNKKLKDLTPELIIK